MPHTSAIQTFVFSVLKPIHGGTSTIALVVVTLDSSVSSFFTNKGDRHQQLMKCTFCHERHCIALCPTVVTQSFVFALKTMLDGGTSTTALVVVTLDSSVSSCFTDEDGNTPEQGAPVVVITTPGTVSEGAGFTAEFSLPFIPREQQDVNSCGTSVSELQCMCVCVHRFSTVQWIT